MYRGRAGRTVILLAVACALALAACQGCPLFMPAGSCRRNVDCQAGQLCVDQRCVKACNGNQDCDSQDQACIEGYCAPIPGARCTADGDCTTPGPCEVAEGALCSGGSCRYQPRPAGESCAEDNLCTSDERCDGEGRCTFSEKYCLDPPPAECVDGDSVYRSYSNPGRCVPETGDCNYPPIDRPCASCSATCAVACTGISCSALNGGCQANGICVPEQPPRCEYQVAADDTACSLPGDPLGTFSGHCLGGQCAGCTDATTCTSPPGDHPECYEPSCSGGLCAYQVLPAPTCEQARCLDGYLYAARVCGAAGDCPETTRQSCHGFRCNPDGLTCLTACGGDGDCVPGAYCDADNQCAGLLEDGESCAGLGSGRCLSGYCDGALCCAGGDCCNLASDCPTSYSHASVCSDSSSATSCQGTRFDASCRDYVCASVPADDDSGCGGLPHACANHLAARLCGNTADQAPPVCPTSCSVDVDCESGYTCNQATHACDRVPGLGDACTGTGQGSCNSGLKCESNVCCQATGPTCCTTSSTCAAGLTCNTTAFACNTTCGNYTADRCADPSATYCLNNACVAKKITGSCQSSIECSNGNCVEGVCCNDVCDGVCASCRGTLTGGSDGTCAPIQAGGQDNAPSALCTASGDGCSGGSCACEGGGIGATRCRRAVGQDCSSDAECATGICECANEQCSARKCSTQWCNACEFTANGSSCTAGLGTSTPIDDPPSCGGTSSCYAGQCKRDNGTSCNVDGDCGSNRCECGDATCSTSGRKCASASCGACEYTIDGSACNGDLAPSVTCSDGNACTRTDTCQAGSCVGSNPVVCNTPRGCEQSGGSCNTGDGSCSYTAQPVGYVCRSSSGVCDRTESCASGGGDCPADAKQPSGTSCSDDGNPCTLDQCNGSSNDCQHPAGNAGTQCRVAAGVCDVAESCTGSSTSCPSDVKRGSGYTCTSDGNPCTLDQCNGTSVDCQHPAGNAGSVCRASAGPCDPAETCTGSSTSCPGDTVASWHSDCGTCRWCEGAACVVNSNDHSDCAGTTCQKCLNGACANAALGEDFNNQCSTISNCTSYVAGWNGNVCHAFSGASSYNGTCNGGGACVGVTQACSGSGATLSSCASYECMRPTACAAGTATSTSDQVTEICFTSGEWCADLSACDGSGYCYYSGSCPILYAWDGLAFRMESDLYPSGMLGLRMGYGFRRPTPHDNYLLRTDPVERLGALEVRLVEERHETDYLDQVVLYAIDVPAGRDVYSELVNTPRGFLPPTALLHTVAPRLRRVESAVLVDSGEDVAKVLAESDHDSLKLSEDNNHCGWHTIEIDLGEVSDAPQIKLVIDAKTVFPSTPAGYAWKNALDPTGISTRLEVLDVSGSWVSIPTSVLTLARPKEFPRPGVTDITSVVIRETHRIRLSYLMKTYVDSIRFDTTADVAVTATEVPLVGGVLAYYGFSAYHAYSNDIDNYELIYGEVIDRWQPMMPGHYTRYGDVTPLLQASDDQFVIFAQGEQLTLLFESPPPSPPATRRRYLLYSNGYYKAWKTADIDHTVEPLPFAAMSNFPYDPLVEHYPDDAEHQQYLQEWNTRLAP